MSDVETRLLHILALEQSRRQVHGEPGQINSVVETGAPVRAGTAQAATAQAAPARAGSEYRYNGRGDLVEILEPDGRQRRYQYDSQRRLVETAHPDGSLTRYVYQDGRLVEMDDRGVLNRFRYDPDGRLAQAERGAESAVYRYDTAGRLILARTPEVTNTWEYGPDPASNAPIRLTQTIQGLSLTIGLTSDEQGRLARLELPGLAEPIQYTWDEKGRPAAVCLGTQELAHYRFDDETKTTRLSCANGLQSELRAGRPDGRPTRFRVGRSQGTLLEQRYAYGLAGETQSDGSRRYTYDQQGRLAAAEAEDGERWDYAYDELDNRVSAAYNGVRLDYTRQAGDQLQAVEGGGAGRTALRFDRRGQLASWRARPAAAASGATAMMTPAVCARCAAAATGRRASSTIIKAAWRWQNGRAAQNAIFTGRRMNCWP